MASSRKRRTANRAERALGVQGLNSGNIAAAMDFFQNVAARTGWGSPNLENSTQYPLVRFTFNYWDLVSMFEGSWLTRRIVEMPAQDALRAWPKLTSDIEPKDLSRIDRALRKTNSKAKVLTAYTWARLFGGAGCLIALKGQEDELDQPLDIDSIGVGDYAGLLPFDRWAGISPTGDVCTDISRPLDFDLPEYYTVRAVGGEGFKVHSSRILRFTGPTVPTPEKEAYSSWGISVIEPVLQDIQKYDNISFNILALSFRANILGMKFPELAQLISGLGMTAGAGSQSAAAKFEQRMTAINHLISNQSLVPLPADGGIESTQYSFSGLSEVFQQFQLAVSGAAQVPVSRLWGKTITGLGQTGDGDEKVYCEKIATDQSTYVQPALEKLFPVICMSELGEVPDDLDLNFPSIRSLDEKELSDLAKTTTDTVMVALNGGVIAPRTAAKELKQQSDVTGIFSNITDEDIEALSDKVVSEGEIGEGLFGEEGTAEGNRGEEENPEDTSPVDPKDSGERGGNLTSLSPSSSPGRVLHEEQRAKDARPLRTVTASKLQPGDCIKVHGKLLTVKSAREAKNLFAEPVIHVSFVTGDAVAYTPTKELTVHAAATGKAQDADIKRSPDFGTTGNYQVTVNGKSYLIYRDPESGWWYEDKTGHYTQNFLGFNKKEAVEKIEQKYGGAQARDADGPAIERRVVHGLPIVIECLKGDIRSGKDWRQVMNYDYGYIDGVQGADGDSLDVCINPSLSEDGGSSWVYLVDQKHLPPKSGFDETKCFIGYPDAASALSAFFHGHDRAKDVIMDWTPMPVSEFKRWIKEGDLTKPCSAV